LFVPFLDNRAALFDRVKIPDWDEIGLSKQIPGFVAPVSGVIKFLRFTSDNQQQMSLNRRLREFTNKRPIS
jgi:hypothetical protein